MLTYRAKRLHPDERNFAYSTLLADNCGFMSMGDDMQNVYFFTRNPISDLSKKVLTDHGIILYLENGGNSNRNTRLQSKI